MKLIVHTDGGARGNPGPAAIGVVIQKVKSEKLKLKSEYSNEDLVLVREYGKRIGETTNNVAEYEAVISALSTISDQLVAKKKSVESVDIFMDSLLVASQLNGTYKVKDPHLREKLTEVRILEQECGAIISYHTVLREQNRLADMLVNRALDARSSLMSSS